MTIITPISKQILIQQLNYDPIEQYGVSLRMARVDQNNDLASGNKLYKLKPILECAKSSKYKQILSFGGAYSNHIHALALLANQEGLESIALIRGEAEYAKNPTLSDAQNAGMHLEFVSRAEYKQRNETQYLADLKLRYPAALIVPEGGSSQLAIQACAQMARDINDIDINQQQSDILTVAAGTGATAAGLVCGLSNNQHLNVYAVLKDESLVTRINDFIFLENEIETKNKFSIEKADFGGYAKLDKALLEFIINWLDQTGILLDPIYTSKMCRRVIQQIKAGEFTKGTSITIIHSGGLQGWRGMQKRVEGLVGDEAWNKINQYLKTI